MALRYPTWLNRNLIGFSVASFLSDISSEMVIVVLPVFLATLLKTASIPLYLGLMSGIPALFASTIRVVSGMLSDYLKRKKYFIVSGYALDGFGTGLIGVITQVWQLLGVRILGMMGQGMREPPRDALISSSVGRRFYGRAFGFHRAMDTLGAFIGPLLVSGILGKITIQHIFFLAAGPSLLAALVVALVTTEKTTETHYSMLSWRKFLAHVKVMPRSFVLFFFVISIFHCAYFNKMILILRIQELAQEKGYTVAYALQVTAILYAFSNIIRACAEYGVGYISDFIGRRDLLGILGYTLFGFIALMVAGTSISLLAMIIVFFFLSISAGTIKVATRAYTAELLPEEIHGTGFGMVQLVEGVGDFVASGVVGLLWSTVSPQIAFFYAAILSWIAALFLLLIPRLARGPLF